LRRADIAWLRGRWPRGQQVPHLIDERLCLKRLRQEAVHACLPAARFVERLVVARQQQHGDVREVRIVLHRGAEVVAVLPRHERVDEDQVRAHLARPRQRFVHGLRSSDGHVLLTKAQLDNFVDRHAVVCQQEALRHPTPPWTRARRPVRILLPLRRWAADRRWRLRPEIREKVSKKGPS
jgi:hypothetical protein